MLIISVHAIAAARKAVDQFNFPACTAFGSSAGPQFAPGRITLQIQLNGTATSSALQSFLRGLKFSTAGQGLNIVTRTLNVTLANSTSLSTTVTQTINVVQKILRAPR